MSLVLALCLQGAVPAVPLEHRLYRAQMSAAESAMRLGEFAEAAAWLAETPESARGFEWHADRALLDESATTDVVDASVHGHPTAVDVSPDGAHVLIGTSSGHVLLRVLDAEPVERVLGAHMDGVTYARFDADGKRVVTASYDRTVKVWSLEGDAPAVEFTGHGFPVAGAAFSPDGLFVASCSYERPPGSVVGTVHVWEAATGALVRTMTGGRKPIVGIEWSPDGSRIAAGSWDFCAFVWPAEGGEPAVYPIPDEGVYNACDDTRFTVDGRHIVTVSKDHTARVFAVEGGALVATLRGHTDAVSKVALSRDGVFVATASADGTLRLWRTSDWACAATLRGHGDDVVSVAFTPDSQQVVSVSIDGTLRTWSSRAELYGGVHTTADAAVYVTTFDPADRRIATASYDGRITVRDAATLQELASWQAHPLGKSCHALAWTPDGARLVSGSWEPVVRVFDAATGEELAALQQPTGTQDLALAPDGGCVATCAGNTVIVWDLTTYEHVHTFEGHTAAVLGVTFSPDSSSCVSGARDGRAIRWDTRTGEQRWEVKNGSSDIAATRFTPDGNAVVIAGRNGKIDLYVAEDGALSCPLARLRHGLDHVDVSPDGTRLAVATHAVLFIDLVHGGVVGEQRRHTDRPYCLEFDSTGTRLVSGSTDKGIVIIDRRPLRER
jgi:WD40 repeat protein